MKNKKKPIFIALLFVFIVGLVIWGIKSTPKIEAPLADSLDGSEQSGIIYYYGQECQHCINVQSFLDENSIEEKVIFSKKEVWHNSGNAQELNMKAEECGLEQDKIGVPFLYAGGDCYMGEIEVENFFKKEAGIIQ